MSTSLQSSTLQSDTFSNGFYPVPESLPVLPEWKLPPVKHSRGTRTSKPMDSTTTSKLDQSGDFNADGSFSTTLNALAGSASGTAVAYVQTAMDSVFNSVLGQANIGVRNLQAAVSDDLKTVYVSGQLNNGNKVTLVVGTTVALDYVATGGLDLGSVTKVDFLKGLGLSSIELVVSSGDVAFENDDGESVDFSRGLHLIGTIDLKSSSNQVFKFINQYAHIDSLEAQVDIAPEDGLALSGTINTNLQLFPIVVSGIINTDIGGGFKIIEKSASIDWSIGKDLEPAAGMSNTLEVRGYDPTQRGEPALTLTGGYSFEPESVTLFGALDTGGLSGWSNPFGFQGAQIRRLGFQVGATYLPPFIDNIGVIAGLKWDQYDVDFAGSLDVNDPEKLGFALTVNQDINVVKMMAQMEAMMLGPAAPAAFKLIDLGKDLFNYIPLTVRSFDSNGDGALDPLVSFVPFATEIAGFSLDEGMGINARVNLAGEVGELALNANGDFTELSGSLRLSNLKLGDNWLVISGTQPGSDLTASFDISPAGAYASGDGKIALFGQTLAQAHFSISPGHIAVTNTILPLIPFVATLNIDSLDVNFNNISASGTTHLNILGYNMAGLSFDMSRQRIHIAGNFDLGPLDINGSMDWNTSQQTLDISGSMSINGVTLGSARVNYDHGALNINGSVGVKIPSIGDINANVTGTFTSNNFALSVGADLGALGHPKISLSANDFRLDNLATQLYNKVASDIGQVPGYIASSIKSGWGDVVHAGNYVINQISGAIDKLFSSSEHNQSWNGDENNNSWDGNGGNDIGMGNGGNDHIDGHQGNDVIDGGAGNDSLYGGSNEDTVYGGDGNDYVTGSEGYDIAYGGTGNDTLEANGRDTLYGGAGDDVLDARTGQNEADSLFGDGGNDILYGGGYNKVSTLTGGTGDDVYYVSGAAHIVIENSDEGTDQVNTDRGGYILPTNVENLYLNGSSNISVSGNELNNVLSGNNGADTLSGGAGDDAYFINNSGTVVTEQANSGVDTINSPYNYTLPANVENLSLTGTATVSGTGNVLDNILNGQSNTAANTLAGGAGNDNYYVGSNDTVIENVNAGTDTIYSAISYTLPANVENLTLTGTSAVNGTGNTQDNILTGNSAANILAGGAGNDSYTVDSLDTVNEDANAGTDTIYTSVNYTLPANVENLVLTGGDFVNATGNVLDNVLTGNSAANSLSGGMGNDSYYVDISDTVSEADNAGTDTLYSSVSYTLPANVENLILTGGDAANARGNALNNLLIGNAAANSLIGGEGADTLKGGLGDDSYSVDSLDTVNEDANAGTDTVYTSVSYTLSANVENLVLTGTDAINATGNTLNNFLTGNAAANSLDGGNGADMLSGGMGNDSYSVDNTLDAVIENTNAGMDTVYSSVSYTLPANVENLTLGGGTPNVRGTGNGLDNVFNIGTAGSNLTLVGGAGNDSYYIDNRVTTVSEDTNAGIDTIYGFGSSFGSSALPANVENMTLMGTGNNSANGNTLDNVLTGNPGANTLSGDLGNDSYYVDGLDTVIENANAGTDTIYSAVSYTLTANVENLVLTGTDAVNATGNTLNNVLTGNSAANSLSGGDGADTLIGGLGNDSYTVDNLDTINEDANAGTDTVYTSVSYTLPANVENLILTGTSAVNGTGNTLDNVLTGNSAANTLVGGAGNDSYTVDSLDTVNEDANAGTDIVYSSGSYTLPANVENLTLTGTSSVNGTGNALDNVLTGNSAANTLVGGAGNDSYTVDSLDTVNEDANAGTDTVYSSVSYTLSANFENLTLTGTSSVNGTGNALDNILTGNSAANTLVGGTGNDSYSVDSLDTVNEDANAGTDTVYSSGSYTLPANVENLTLTGTSSVNGTGNALDNILTGNSAANTLVGGTGNDSYSVDSLDTVNEDANAGTDTVYSSGSYTLPANVENLILTGSDAVNATGNALANVLTGNAAANSLTGGEGADTLTGGLGDDSYSVDSLDTVNEDANAGMDTVYSSVSYTLPANVENLVLTGLDTVNGTGNTQDNILTGNSAANSLMGGDGADTLKGGLGDDSYYMDSLDTVIEDANAGMDTVYTSVSYTLSANVENLVLTGTDAINATGNTLNNVLTGNAAANSLDGGNGADTLSGGMGNDSYSVDNTLDAVIENTNAGMDTVYSSVNYTLPANVENLTLGGGTPNVRGTGNGLDNVFNIGTAGSNLTLVGGAGNDSYYIDSRVTTVSEDTNAGIDTIYGFGSSFLFSNAFFGSSALPANVENMTLMGTGNSSARGNALDNVLTGNPGANTLSGDLGNDSYYVDSLDTVIENANAGTDTIYTSVNYTLPANVENLTLTGTSSVNGTGNALDNILTGNSAANTLVGGAGNDSYTVDSLDIVNEDANAGTDTVYTSVSYTLPANVENLILTGSDAVNATGNTLANVLTGNSAANSLTGGDGADTLTGGLGDDSYSVDSLDTVNEDANAGTDTIYTSVSYVLPLNVENLVLTGTDAINATGNTLNNVLTGNAAANSLDGGNGADTLKGGLGDDSYSVDSLDTVSENANAGTDTVYTSVSYTLPANVENLILTGSDAVNATGNTLANVLTGNSAANSLTGGDGADTLEGGLGDDRYFVDSLDTVNEDFNAGMDTVYSSGSYTLPVRVENLTLMNSGDNSALGNALGNVLTGNPGKNQLSGLNGADTLDGAAGTDTLIGGAGQDQFNFSNIDQRDTIQDFSALDDTIGLSRNVFTKITSWSSDNFVNGTVAKDSNDYIIYDKATGILSYDADGNGAAASPIKIALIGNVGVALDATDFILV